MLQKVVVSTDLSSASLPAIELASTIVSFTGGVLDIVHVVDAPVVYGTHFATDNGEYALEQANSLLEQAQLALEDITKPFCGNINVNKHVLLYGNPAEEILKFADKHASTCIVMSTHGRSSVANWVLGSVTERVLRASSCSIATIKMNKEQEFEINEVLDEEKSPKNWIPKKILVPIDMSEASLSALQKAIHISSVFDAEVVILHVIDMSYATLPLLELENSLMVAQKIKEKARDQVNNFLKKHENVLSQEVFSFQRFLKIGEASQEILTMSDEHNVDWIIMGKTGYTGIKRWLMGSVAEKVVRNANCVVLSVS